MILRIFLSLWLALTPGFAWAQSMLLLGAGGAGAAAAPYQGPGDVLSGWFYWGSAARCYSSVFSGSIADIVDSATGNTTGTRLQCAAGGVVSAVVSSSACSFVTGNACSPLATTCASACKITKLYDQSGNSRDISNATLVQMPVITASGLNGLPIMVGASGVTALSSASTFTISNPITFYGVAERTAAFTTAGSIIGASGVTQFIGGGGTTGNFQVNGGTEVDAAASNSAWHVFSGMIGTSANTCATNVDGIDTASLTCGTVSFTLQSLRIFRNSAGTQFNGNLAEVGIYSAGATTSTNRNNLCHNASAAYALGFGC